jgi:hypothetical protein
MESVLVMAILIDVQELGTEDLDQLTLEIVFFPNIFL